MIKYRGKYPKNINSVYSIKEEFGGGMGATLNDGTLIKFFPNCAHLYRPGYTPKIGTYETIGQSKIRA